MCRAASPPHIQRPFALPAPVPAPVPAPTDSFALPAPAAPVARAAASEPTSDPSLVALEEAVAQCILADCAAANAAARVGLSREALTQLVIRYREIGRRALTDRK